VRADNKQKKNVTGFKMPILKRQQKNIGRKPLLATDIDEKDGVTLYDVQKRF